MVKKYILENGKKFFVHPIYTKYAANEDGEIIHAKLGKPRKGNVDRYGYFKFSIYLERNRIKSYFSHRFVYECFYGLIEKNKHIDHINFIRNDNRITNLSVVSPSENNKKSSVNKDYTFLKDIRKNPKKVKAINLETKKETNFNSLYSVNKILGINAGQVSMICEGKNCQKKANSKVDGCKYTFHYI